MPSDSTLTIWRETAWDFSTVAIGTDGAFIVEGLPHEPLTLGIGVPGYRLSWKNLGATPGRPTLAIPPIEGALDLTLYLDAQPRVR